MEYNDCMQGKSIVSLVLVILVVVGAFFYLRMGQSKSLTPIPSVSPTDSGPYCSPGDLQSLVELGAGAGNVYGTLTLKNISQDTCEVLGGDFVVADYDSSVKNITITHIGQTQAQPFVLAPGQTIYSQVHYPNGPQCQSIGLNQTNVTFTYQISPTDTVSFKNQQGGAQQILQTCKSPNDRTEIQIWNMANHPITP